MATKRSSSPGASRGPAPPVASARTPMSNTPKPWSGRSTASWMTVASGETPTEEASQAGLEWDAAYGKITVGDDAHLEPFFRERNMRRWLGLLTILTLTLGSAWSANAESKPVRIKVQVAVKCCEEGAF